MIEVGFQVRKAVPQDQHQIANLMFFESHVHRHLDWRTPLEWLGSSFYWVVEYDGKIQAVLACPEGPARVAWVRLFAHSGQLPIQKAWESLWQVAQNEIAARGGATVAVIATKQWLSDLLTKYEFDNTQDIVMLEWNSFDVSVPPSSDEYSIREMTVGDLPQVAELDATAFQIIWQNPLDALEKALPQAMIATVVEDPEGLVGYQLSTANPFGAHLARLAVRPGAQRRGLGTAIVLDLLHRLHAKNVSRLTVNTQNDNHASLALYKKLGFTMTGEQFPVYCFTVPLMR